ncbi:MAG: transcriptional regulator NrdR [Patescibacteria group bacterium]|nr:transcriptional regulator NrdR [Patescibacteria group bacterium]
MKCPYCGFLDSQVLESRVDNEHESIRRRRKCLKCKKRFTTYERVKKSSLWVVKKNGLREPFDREKVRKGILKAIEKRPVSLDLVESLVNNVEQEMFKKGRDEIYSSTIGKAVLRRLKKIDKVAWLRFASVYLEFEDLEDFAKAIEKK